MCVCVCVCVVRRQRVNTVVSWYFTKQIKIISQYCLQIVQQVHFETILSEITLDVQQKQVSVP